MTTLIISEKPNAGKRIAEALADKGTLVNKSNGRVPYYEFTNNGKKFIVGCAVGHLFTLAEKEKKSWTYPVFDIEWKASHEVSKGAKFTKPYLATLKMLSKKADSFINACDLDREGELIFRNILYFVCKKKNAKRMNFSTLTKSELMDAFKNASPHINFGLVEAGETRHFLDYFWGISVSRALTLSLKTAGWYKVLSTGRVQGPTLAILKNRQKEIEKFKPVPYWQLMLTAAVATGKITAFHIKNIFWDKGEVSDILAKCKGKPAFIKEIKKSKKIQNPGFPFDLTTLQREAYANFGYSPKQTLDITQNLYEQALISYPRTSSQKLPAKIGYKNIIKNLTKQKKYANFCKDLLKGKLKPNEGKKTDPAHPSIFPTGNNPKALNNYQNKIYDLITRRFLSLFAEPAIRESMKIEIEIAKEIFVAKGMKTLKPGWMDIYRPYVKLKEQTLPHVTEKEKVEVEKLEMLDKETTPPKRFTQASILKEMENENLGTKATRAQILETLYNRDYIREKTILVTKLGESVINGLEKFCPEIISPELTKKCELELEEIENGKKKMEKVIEEAKKTLEKILKKFKQNEKKIGAELLNGLREASKEASIIGKCKCGGDLVIKWSKNKKRFVACTKYPKCTETFSLPQKGNLTILKDECKKCGLHIILVKAFKKRPWKLCIKCGFVNIIKKKTGAVDSG